MEEPSIKFGTEADVTARMSDNWRRAISIALSHDGCSSRSPLVMAYGRKYGIPQDELDEMEKFAKEFLV